MCSIFNIDCSSFKNGCKKRMKRALKKQTVSHLFFTGEKPFVFFFSISDSCGKFRMLYPSLQQKYVERQLPSGDSYIPYSASYLP